MNLAAAPPFALLVVFSAEVPLSVRASLARCRESTDIIKQSTSFLLEILTHENSRTTAWSESERIAAYSAVRRAATDMTNATRALRAEFASLRSFDVETAIEVFGNTFYLWRDDVLQGQDGDEVALGNALRIYLQTIDVPPPRHSVFPT